MTAAITTEGLHKRYGARTAIHELDLTVEPGTVFGLIGPNGAGKTTTLRMLLDIIRPTAGRPESSGKTPAEADRPSADASDSSPASSASRAGSGHET